jgi:hypothetical protein
MPPPLMIQIPLGLLAPWRFNSSFAVIRVPRAFAVNPGGRRDPPLLHVSTRAGAGPAPTHSAARPPFGLWPLAFRLIPRIFLHDVDITPKPGIMVSRDAYTTCAHSDHLPGAALLRQSAGRRAAAAGRRACAAGGSRAHPRASRPPRALRHRARPRGLLRP